MATSPKRPSVPDASSSMETIVPFIILSKFVCRFRKEMEWRLVE